MPPSKKRKTTAQASAKDGKESAPDEDEKSAAWYEEIDYQPLSLQGIYDRVEDLCRRVPRIPEGRFRLEQEKKGEDSETNGSKRKTVAEEEATLPVPTRQCLCDKTAVRDWALAVQLVLEEFHLLAAAVSTVTYQWGNERSGAYDQNLSWLSTELARSQDEFLTRIQPRLNDVLAPVMTLLTHKTVTVKETVHGQDAEVKQNYFVTTPEDPDFVNLSFTLLAHHAPMFRHILLANLSKILQTLTDYLASQRKEHGGRTGLMY